MRRDILAMATFVIVAAGAPSVACAETVQGTARGQATPQLQGVGGSLLLQSFYVRFTSEDHHFRTLTIMPGRPERDQALIRYSDVNSDDPFAYEVSFVPYSGPASANVARRTGCRGSCSVPLTVPAGLANYVFVLKGFTVSYLNEDHHIDQLMLSERNGALTVALNDQNDDDPFSFEVTYAYIPRAQFAVVQRMTGAVHNVGGGPIGGGTPVIRGFNFDFRESDHHITEIGVRLRGNGQLAAHYADVNKDDQFYYTVEYGIIRP